MLHEAMTMDVRDFGAYTIVLDLIYQYGGAVPDDAHLISRYMSGCNAIGWKSIRSRLIASGHIYQDGDTLRSQRSDAELQAAARIREANAMGGHMSQAIQRHAKRLSHPPDRSQVRSQVRSQACHWSKLKPEPAKNNDLAEVHFSYSTTTATNRERIGEKEAPSSSFENDAVAKKEKGLGEGEQASSGAEPEPIVVTPYLARQIKSRPK
jgi:uncharacterized protein YdaU (DUF1376 family)